MLKEFIKLTVSANLVIINENGENIGRFHCSGAVLNKMFGSVKGTQNDNIEETDTSKLSRKLIIETPFSEKGILRTYNGRKCNRIYSSCHLTIERMAGWLQKAC